MCPEGTEGGKFIDESGSCRYFDPATKPKIHCDSDKWEDDADKKVVSILCYNTGTYMDSLLLQYIHSSISTIFSSFYAQ